MLDDDYSLTFVLQSRNYKILQRRECAEPSRTIIINSLPPGWEMIGGLLSAKMLRGYASQSFIRTKWLAGPAIVSSRQLNLT